METCQSCGMVMKSKELKGKNKDGSINEDYCKYCYTDGEFDKPNETFEEMVETCIPFMTKEGYTEDQARENLTGYLKTLKRWS